MLKARTTNTTAETRPFPRTLTRTSFSRVSRWTSFEVLPTLTECSANTVSRTKTWMVLGLSLLSLEARFGTQNIVNGCEADSEAYNAQSTWEPCLLFTLAVPCGADFPFIVQLLKAPTSSAKCGSADQRHSR